MKTLKLSVMVAVLALVASGIQAQTRSVIFNEDGIGTLDGQPIPFTIGQDVGPGGLPNALLYQLPALANWTVGDLELQEPSGSGGGSDLIRFNPNGVLVFYSDTEAGEPPDSLADIGLPTQRYTNNLTRTELGDEGANGILYVPTEGSNPGFIGGLQVEYNITSDVPEPATLSLLALGGLAMLRGRK
jgi:hypothetical protein